MCASSNDKLSAVPHRDHIMSRAHPSFVSAIPQHRITHSTKPFAPAFQPIHMRANVCTRPSQARRRRTRSALEALAALEDAVVAAEATASGRPRPTPATLITPRPHHGATHGNHGDPKLSVPSVVAKSSSAEEDSGADLQRAWCDAKPGRQCVA